MSIVDRIRAWFKGETKREAPSKSTSAPTTEAAKELQSFMRSREGVEGYLEPKTAIYSTTLLLVAGNGEYLRRPVRDRDHAASICKKQGVPLYEAQKVGYPKRMRDYDAGRRRDTVSLEDLPPWPGDEDDDGPGGSPGRTTDYPHDDPHDDPHGEEPEQ